MSRQGTIKRYLLLIQKLENRKYPSFEDFKSMLEDEGFSTSKRTLQRDIEQMRGEFGIDIKYDKTHNGYYTNKKGSLNFESFVSFIELIATSNLLINTIQQGKEALGYISFESEGSLKGVQYLKTILEAIKDKSSISFKHFNFSTEKWKNFILEPYVLKQYQSRWYVCGKLKERPFLIIFGLDRMEDVLKLEDKFIRSQEFDPKEYFGSVIGLMGAEGEKVEISLSIKYPNAHYFKTLPLHSSQHIESDDGKDLVISIKVVPNFELKQKILSQAENIHVLKPQWLVDEIKGHCRKMLENYKE